MKIEFHYYITHLIAARAGFRGDDPFEFFGQEPIEIAGDGVSCYL
jgi:hypothetical protein